MFEKKHQPVAPFSVFLLRLLYSFSIGVMTIMIALAVGMLGYHYFENKNGIDAFLNASMILSDMGIASPILTPGGKMFASCYALFSGLIFVSVMGVIFAPIIHRFLHHFHSEE